MAAGTAPGRPRLAWLALAVAVVVVVVVAVLVVRSVRSPGGPIATDDPTPTATVPSSSSSVRTSSSPSRGNSASGRPTSSPTTSATTTPTTSPEPTTGPRTKSPAPLDKSATVDRGLTARVSKLEAVTGKAQGPGEISGPAVRVSITLTNRSGRTVNLSNTVVNLIYGADQAPASVISGPGARALPTSVKDGEEASGRFVFSVPTDQRAEVLITVDYSVKTEIVAFRGKAPG